MGVWPKTDIVEVIIIKVREALKEQHKFAIINTVTK